MSKESKIKESVLAARVRFLMVQSPLGIVMSPLGSCAISLALMDNVSVSRLALWNGVMILLAFLRLLVWKNSPRQIPDTPNPKLWEALFGLSMVAVGIWWGFGMLLVLPGTLEGNLLVFCTLMMMLGGTSALYSVHPVHTMFAVLAIGLPISVTFICQDETIYRVLGFGALLFQTGCLRGVQTLSHFLVKSHELTYELEENVSLLERSEEMRKDLTLMLVHDLRTPLTGLIGRAHLAQEYGEENQKEECDAELMRVVQLSRSLVDMINSVLDVNRLESDQMPLEQAPVPAKEILQSTLQGLGALSHRVHIEVEENLVIHCDPELIRRVILNLLGNALRYQPESEPVRVCAHLHNNGIEVRVIDQGPGVHPEYHATIFDKYAQTAKEDRQSYTSGLGLTFCKLVVERHGGSIGVDSQLGEGAEFWFRIPSTPLESTPHPRCSD